MRATDATIFYTDQEVDEYNKSTSKRSVDKVFGLNNGIETKDIKKLRAPFIVSERPRDLLFLGRLTKKAELSLLLRAMASAECQKLSLDVIGDGPEKPLLLNLAEELGISHRVVWHGAITDELGISAVVNLCKVLVYPGSVGLSLIHAMAYGLPAIIHNDRWKHMPEIAAYREGETGVSYSRDSLSSLAGAISSLIADSVRLEDMSSVCVSLTDSTFNLDDMAQRFVKAVEKTSIRR